MNKIYFSADIHGNPIMLKQMLLEIGEYDTSDTIVLLGDSGFNYYGGKKDKKLKYEVNNLGITIFTIKGNHEMNVAKIYKDNKDTWHTEKYFGGTVYVENEFPNIKYATNAPAIYTIGGHKTLIIGGAYSVDKYFRISNGWKWFEDEQLNKSEKTLGEMLVAANPDIEMVLSHTCPLKYEPTELFLDYIEQDEVDKSMETYLDGIEEKLDYKVWLWGHFHGYKVTHHNDKKQIMLCNSFFLTLEEIFDNI